MVHFTFNTLATEVQRWAEDDSSEFDDSFPQMLRVVEHRLWRLLDTSGFINHKTSTLSSGDPYVTKPSENAILRDFVVMATDGVTRTLLVPTTRSFVEWYWPDRTSSSTNGPRYWAEWTATALVIAPTPDAALNVEMAYSDRLEHLSTDATTSDMNWLTRQAEDLLLYGCLVEAEGWHKNFEKAQYWEQKFKETLLTFSNESRRMRRDDTKVPRNPLGPENDL